MKIALPSFILFFASAISAQPDYFFKTFGDSLFNEKAMVAAQLPGGNIFIAGYSDAGVIGENDITFLKLDKNGAVIWEKFYGTPRNDYCNRMVRTPGGDFVLAGETQTDAGDLQGLLIKVDTSGNLVWQKTYGDSLRNESFSGLDNVAGGELVACGFATGSAGTGNDIYLVKIAADGSLIWQKSYGGIRNEIANNVKQAPDGGFVVACDKQKSDGSYNMYVLKTDSAGAEIWNLDVVNSYNGGNKNLLVHSGGDYVIVGESYSPTSFGAFDMYLVKISPAGDLRWAKYLPGTSHGEAAFAVMETASGGYFVTGYGYNTATPGADIPVIYVDSGGVEVSKKFFNGGQIEIGYDIVPSVYGGFLVAGAAMHNGGNQYVLIYDQLPVASLPALPSGGGFHFYPSVVSPGGRLYFSDPLKDCLVEIFDVAGRRCFSVFHTETGTGVELPLSLSPGIYVVKLTIDDRFFSEKVVVR